MISRNQLQKLLIYLFALLCGLSSYVTKFYSLKILINSFSLQEYPFVLMLTGVSLYLFYNFISPLLKRSSSFSGIAAFILPAVIIYMCRGESSLFWTNTFYFIGLLVSTQFIDLNLKSKLKTNFSLLKDSKLVSIITFVEELGILIPSLLFLVLPRFLEGNVVLYLIPLGVTFLLALMMKGERRVKTNVDTEQDKGSESEKYSFVFPAIVFFSSLMLIRQLQNFGSFIGMRELTEAGYTVGQLFSYVNIAQFILIFLIIGSKIIFQKKNQAWVSGVNIFIMSQAAFFLVLTFLMSPILLISSSVVRKVFAHTTLSESLKLLNSNFPTQIANSLQLSMNKYGSLISYFSMGFISYLFINKFSIQLMWPFALIITLGVYLIGKYLFEKLIEFQVSNIFNQNVYEAVNSCYGLANKKSSLYSSSLGVLIKQNHPPILLKAIIYALGEMKGEGSAKNLMDAYSNFEREDIQLEIIEALAKFDDHDVDLFLLLTLEEIITTQTSLGEIRKQIFEAIISRVNVIAIPLVLGLLESKKDDDRVLANVVMILGEIAVQKKDMNLFERLLKYTDESYPRRIRSNALIYLYPVKKYQMKSFGIISSFMISEDVYDQNAAAFLAGELNIKSISTFVLQKSNLLNRKNSTLEISLLKMDNPTSAEKLSDIILEDDLELAYICLNQFNSIKSKTIRYRVYNYILEKRPESLNLLVTRMAQSLRNFDEDRMLLYAEAKRIGIEVESPLKRNED